MILRHISKASPQAGVEKEILYAAQQKADSPEFLRRQQRQEEKKHSNQSVAQQKQFMAAGRGRLRPGVGLGEWQGKGNSAASGICRPR
jgi:hypothetical protein